MPNRKSAKTSHSVAESSHDQPHSATIRHRVAFDGGNRFIKWLDRDGSPRKIPSYIYEIPDWRPAPTNIDPDSVLIECESRRFIVGQEAKNQGGVPTFERDKNALARDLVLVALEPEDGREQLLVETLAIATPNTNNQAAMRQLQKLQCTRTFKRNGTTVTAMVRQVEPIDECLTAWRFAYNKGVFEYAQNNAVLDLGGGTGIARIISPVGNVIDSATVIVPGTANLAFSIATALQSRESFTPNTGLIMDAIEDGSFVYHGEGSKHPFEAIFLHCRQEWLSDIRSKLKQAWATHLSQIGEILIIGGSARLASELDGKGRYKIATYGNVQDFHQFVSLYGLAEEV